MAGFDNDVVYGTNIDLRGVKPVVGQFTTDGQLLIGSTASPHARIGTVSAGTGISISNGSGSITINSTLTPIITTFASSGSWSINANTKVVEFFIWSGAGGGGSGRCGNTGSSGGGAGGGPGSLYYFKTQASLLTGSPYTVTVGAGGNGGISVNAVLTPGNAGDPGGVSSVGTVLLSSGGTGGAAGGLGTSTGGTSSYFNLYTLIGVLNGGSGTTTNASSLAAAQYAWGTGGGGAAGFTSGTGRTGTAGANIIDASSGILVTGGTAGNNSGSNGGNGNSPLGTLPLSLGATGGGGGGCDGVSVSGSGGNGAIPSGAGGGGAGALSSTPSGAGGNGAKGKIIIIEYI